jgi:hypothetical protein
MYFIFKYENRIIKAAEIVLRREGERMKENDGGGESKIHCKQICKYHNVTPCSTIIS